MFQNYFAKYAIKYEILIKIKNFLVETRVQYSKLQTCVFTDGENLLNFNLLNYNYYNNYNNFNGYLCFIIMWILLSEIFETRNEMEF